MNAITLINENANINKLLEYYGFNNIKQSGKMIRACCKLHNGDNPSAFVIDSETGLWYCHTGNCGGGDIYDLVQKMQNLTFKKAVHWLASFFNVDISKCDVIERKNDYLSELNKWVKMMRNQKKIELKEFNIKEEVKLVTKFRNFKLETLQHFNLGYVESVQLNKKNGGIYTLQNRLVFPVIFKGVQVGIAFRRIKSSDVPKWSLQPANLEYRNILYNYDNIIGKKEIVICEGILDVWAFHEIGVPATATFGAHITKEQYKLILNTGADITLAYDGDNAGSIANQKGIEMFKNKANINLITFPQSFDPESVTREELIRLYETRRKL